MLHRTLLTAACAGVLFTPTPAQADGGPSPLLFEREFLVSLTAKSTTDMVMPRHDVSSNCSGTAWTEGSEKEVWTFSSRQPVRMGITGLGHGNASFIRTDVDDLARGVPAGGSITRDQRFTNGRTAGSCGSGSPPVTDIGDDCGTKMVGYDVHLQLVSGRLGISLADEPGTPADQGVFKDCGISRAYSWGGSDFWSNATGSVSYRTLMRTTRTLVIRGRRSKTEILSESSQTKTTTTTEVTVKLKPLKARRGRET